MRNRINTKRIGKFVVRESTKYRTGLTRCADGAPMRICLAVLVIAVFVSSILAGKTLPAQENAAEIQLKENSVRVPVRNLEKTLKLYREILGFSLDGVEVLHGKDVDGTLVMKLSGSECKVNLLLPSLENDANAQPSVNGSHNYVLSVPDVVSVCDKLKAEGYELNNDDYGRDKYSFFSGPNGETISLTSFPVATKADDWKELLDENLSQWEAHTGVAHKSVEVPGRARSKSENGIDGDEPIGLGDPLGIYTVKMVDGEPILKVTGQVFAGLTSLEEFDSYHLSLQFRWGEKKWEPRLDKLRDSGLLFHCVGPHGAGWNAWMQSLECQIQEGDCGDFIPVDKARAFAQLRADGTDQLAEYEIGVYDPSKPLKEVRGKIVVHRPSLELPNGQWNTIEIYALDTRAIFVVNGIPNMAIFDAQQTVDGKFQPLNRGKLQIQSEAAELEYRRIKIRPISAFPKALSKLAERPPTD